MSTAASAFAGCRCCCGRPEYCLELECCSSLRSHHTGIRVVTSFRHVKHRESDHVVASVPIWQDAGFKLHVDTLARCQTSMQSHIPTRSEAFSLLRKFNDKGSLLNHALAVEGTMRFLARKHGEAKKSGASSVSFMTWTMNAIRNNIAQKPGKYWKHAVGLMNISEQSRLMDGESARTSKPNRWSRKRFMRSTS